MDQLESLRAFEAAARHGSFAAAGRALHLTRDQVSKLVLALEERVGARLFERSTRAVTLTPDGVEYVERIRRVLRELDAADGALRNPGDGPSGLLTVHAPLSWGHRVLSPLCAEFRTAFPRVRVELTLDDRPHEDALDGAHVRVRIVGRFDGTAAVEPLGRVHRAVYAAPAYLSRQPPPEEPEDLVEHECVHYASLATGQDWVLESEGEVRRVPVHGGFSSNTGLAVRAAVLAGAGIGLLPDFLVEESVATGALHRVLPRWEAPVLSVFALVRPELRASPTVRAYLAFLRERLGVPQTRATS